MATVISLCKGWLKTASSDRGYIYGIRRDITTRSPARLISRLLRQLRRHKLEMIEIAAQEMYHYIHFPQTGT